MEDREINPVIIYGAANGDTDALEKFTRLSDLSGWDIIDLNDFMIGHFDFTHQNKNDDFLPLIRRLIQGFDTFIFATPVYWYAMSGVMKVFFDRLADLVTIEKELGRKLRGRQMAAITTSNGNHLGEAFWLPFSETANYLGMRFITGVHTSAGAGELQQLEDFVLKVKPQE